MSLDTGPIQSPALGFLSLLNLKNKGLLPDVLIGKLQPVIDLGGYFLRGSLMNAPAVQRVQAPAVVTNFVPFTVTLTVPDNETWYVEHATLRATAAAAGNTCNEYAFGYQLPGGITPWFMLSNSNQVDAVKTCTTVSAQGFWLPSGAVLGAFIGTVAVGNVTFDLVGFRYQALRA